MNYETARFGSLEIKDDEIINFPDGLYGFDKEKEFVLLPLDPQIESPMEWLQSLRTPELAFVVTDPFLFVPQYKMVLSDDEKDQLKIKSAESVMIRVIVTIPKVHADMTANLVAPLVINQENRLARQIVLTTAEYDTRHCLLPKGDPEPQQKV
ncbi:flagellar assembly factor FliW [Candidatus Nitromaritima sp. SCGC AAA799-A02]|nr:flagellar assembly factor FliW [Candidatus Nitromaritima sp. SCGC AAA799-A02]KMP11820.1 flagellar assembly factor FliW [Candidatus Nitromaritima sp. SCGC AAA799-C22]